MAETKQLSKTEQAAFNKKAKSNLASICKLRDQATLVGFKLGKHLYEAFQEGHHSVAGFESMSEWLASEGFSPAYCKRLSETYYSVHQAGSTIEEVEGIDPEALYPIREIITASSKERIFEDARNMPRDTFLLKWKQKAAADKEKKNEARKKREAKKQAALRKPPKDLRVDGKDLPDDDEEEEEDETPASRNSDRMEDILRIVTNMTGADLDTFIPRLAQRLGAGFVMTDFLVSIAEDFSDGDKKRFLAKLVDAGVLEGAKGTAAVLLQGVEQLSDEELMKFLKGLVKLEVVGQTATPALIGYLVAKMGANDPDAVLQVGARVVKVKKQLGIE